MSTENVGYSLERVPFRGDLPLDLSANTAQRLRNWPAVYVLDNKKQVYVGETTNTLTRRGQHQQDPKKAALTTMRVILHDRFNKSAALDLEAFLIKHLAADQGRQSLNGNMGLREHDYYQREQYQALFEEIFERLREERVFSQSRDQIINSTLFKLSPFKSLTTDQEQSLADIVHGILSADDPEAVGPFVVQGGPGTGKTVLGVFLMKLLADLAVLIEDPDATDLSTDEVFHPLFTRENHERLLAHRVDKSVPGLTIGIVVPQQSLRRSLRSVFRHTPGLHPNMVVDPWEVGQKKFAEKYDVLIVDEAHRLSIRASQSSGVHNALYPKINQALFGVDDTALTQLDWITDRSVHQILLLDPKQTVRPADLDPVTVRRIVDRAHSEGRFHPLVSQLRVEASDEYVSFFSDLLSGLRPVAPRLGEYDLRLFTDFGAMREAIMKREEEFGLARLAAGYAWEWKSRGTKKSPATQNWDIELDGVCLPWNRTDKEWVTSPTAIDEVGSIHTLQGYDLNYAGVVIGPDLQWDERTQQVVFSREDYFDKRGKRNNPQLGLTYSDDELRSYVINIYNVLLTRGIRGTYIYVVDRGLHEQFARWFGTGDDEETAGAPFSVPPGLRPQDSSGADLAHPHPDVDITVERSHAASPSTPSHLNTDRSAGR